ncbi:MAG: radical SAM family heme chaperone HemW [Flavobacteriaceae bacterium]|nr:radical SAM family heme chaperone HemW [Flavobacteriaceae bacterium]
MSGIYLHIPFCKQACYYCDFHFSTSLKKKSEMIQAIADELILRKNELTQTIETIYFGGGTPSLLTIDDLRLLIDTVYENYSVIENPEITLEANPDDLNELKIEQLANSLINRLSIGIQSFFDDDLQFMNRAHNAKEAMNSLLVATPHFDNITIDLIYGIPSMSVEKWKQNLQKTFDFGVSHISSYALTVEPKTALANFIKKEKYPPLDETLAANHFDVLMEETTKNGFIQYEISNFGKPNFFSKHNTSYWQGKHYLGIGPSAHSYHGKTRSWNVSNNARYIKSIQQKILPQEIEKLTNNDRFNEKIMTGLRTIWGVSLINIEKNYGIEIKNKLLNNAQKYIQNNTLKIKNNILLITDKGKFLADGIAADLFVV